MNRCKTSVEKIFEHKKMHRTQRVSLNELTFFSTATIGSLLELINNER